MFRHRNLENVSRQRFIPGFTFMLMGFVLQGLGCKTVLIFKNGEIRVGYMFVERGREKAILERECSKRKSVFLFCF